MEIRGKTRWVIAAAVLTCGTPALAHEECDEDQPRPAAAVESAQPQIAIKLFQFQPARIEVTAGSTVTWVNEDEILHTVTAEKSGGFDVALDGKGKRFSFTFAEPGIYMYHCDRHEHMRGEVVVR